MIDIKLASIEDLSQCANILMNIYNSNVLNEGWNKETSFNICKFYYTLQPDLFYVAKDNDKVVGFTFSYIKPWAKGNQLMVEELSVLEDYRKQKIASKLLKKLITTAKEKYNIITVCGTTYNSEQEMPFSWYKRIGFEKIEDLYLIEANVDEIISKL